MHLCSSHQVCPPKGAQATQHSDTVTDHFKTDIENEFYELYIEHTVFPCPARRLPGYEIPKPVVTCFFAVARLVAERSASDETCRILASASRGMYTAQHLLSPATWPRHFIWALLFGNMRRQAPLVGHFGRSCCGYILFPHFEMSVVLICVVLWPGGPTPPS